MKKRENRKKTRVLPFVSTYARTRYSHETWAHPSGDQPWRRPIETPIGKRKANEEWPTFTQPYAHTMTQRWSCNPTANARGTAERLRRS
eukprot:scaffold2324_cov266-Pinguiococcus_pyrenoidosus.AAC.11